LTGPERKVVARGRFQCNLFGHTHTPAFEIPIMWQDILECGHVLAAPDDDPMVRVCPYCRESVPRHVDVATIKHLAENRISVEPAIPREEATRMTPTEFTAMISTSEYKTIQDRRKGALYGQAIGDALGAPYEFGHMVVGPKEDAVYRDSPRGTFKKGEFTDDTAQALILAKVLSATPDADILEIAQSIAGEFINWLLTDGRGAGRLTVEVLTNPMFNVDPIAIAENYWVGSNRQAAPNGAVMRTAGMAIVKPWNPEWTIRMADLCCRVTHADPRCLASAVSVSCTIAALICGCSIPKAIEIGLARGSEYDPEIIKYASLDIKGLNLNEPHAIGYTYKTAGAGFWALKNYHLYGGFADTLTKVIRGGGDTDTNAAVAGAMLGAGLGFDLMQETAPGLIDGLQGKDALEDVMKNLPAIESLSPGKAEAKP